MSIYFMLFAVHVLIAFAGYKLYKMIKAEDARYADEPGHEANPVAR